MKNCLALSLVTFLLLLVNQALSQDIIFNNVIPPAGRPFGWIGGITQDKNGYMWFATRLGLHRHDGYKFKLYLHDPSNLNSLSSNHLETVHAGSNGDIWIATNANGVDKLNPYTGVFTHFGLSEKLNTLSSDTVRAILEDHEGIVWIGTHNGLDRIDNETGRILHYRYNRNDPSTISSNIVRALYEDKSGTLWVGTGSTWSSDGGGADPDDGGLNRFDRKTGRFTRYKHDPGNANSLINNKVRAIFEDSRGIFWIGTGGDGLHTMDKNKGTFIRHTYDSLKPHKLSRPRMKVSYSAEHITFITEDAVGSIWIGSILNGINRYDPKTNTTIHYGTKDSSVGFNANSGWSVCNSRDGILWIGSWEGGHLFRIDPFHKKIPFIYTGSPVNTFKERNPTELWIGTNNGLILRDKYNLRSKKFILDENNPASLSNDIIYSLGKDSHGTLWVGTHNGLNRLNEDENSFTRIRNNSTDSGKIITGEISAIVNGGADSLWIGTYNGLYSLNTNKNTLSHFRHNPKDLNSLKRNEIFSLETDLSGNLWIDNLFGDGLDHFDKSARKFKSFLIGIPVISIFKSVDGLFWIGTENGLYKSDDITKSVSKFVDPASGIETAFIIGIQEDNQHNLWVSSLSGIFKINLANNQTTVFGSNHGVNASQLSRRAIYKGFQGEIYIGEQNGYYVFPQDQVYTNPKPPQIVLTEFQIGEKPVRSGPNQPLNEPIEIANEISLNYSQNVFSFEFAGISYSNPEHNRHLYMLENYEKVWHETGAEKTATYYNVLPSTYFFRVKAASSDGIWSEKTIKITITPPWWRTWWAYCIYGLLFFASAYAIHQIQRRRLIEAERERTRVREMAQAKEIEKAYHELSATQAQLIQREKMASLGELNAGIAHELQNPLNFVNNFSEVNVELIADMQHELNAGNKEEAIAIGNDIRENQQKINHHGQRADAIIKSMLQHSRTSTGQKEPTDINALVDEYLRLSYHGMRAKDKSFNATMQTDFDENIGKINIVPQDIGRVVLNLFNNAFYSVSEKKRQTKEFDPKLLVTTKKISMPKSSTGSIEIRVRDNGLGIPQRIIDKIYQPFFTTKPTGQGTGLGLSISYDIIKAHGGELKVETKEGEFAEFVIQLPLDK